jgi:outer membrane protein OmpA-like peptidoglycan-associated protein
MFQRLHAVAIGIALAASSAFAADCPPVTHLPNIPEREPAPQVRSYDTEEFYVRNGDDTPALKVSGHSCRQDYDPKDGAPEMSVAEIKANYQALFQHLGGEVYDIDDYTLTTRLPGKNGQTTWAKVVIGGAGSTSVTVVDEKPFVPSIPMGQPESLKTALDRDGHVPLHLNFDFAKATLLPDAQPVLAQVVAMLKADPALKLSVEGHTDGVGGAKTNQALSQQRAAAVVAALTQAGIAANRLKAVGYGASKPVDSNETTEGRAKNRRVELVKLKG